VYSEPGRGTTFKIYLPPVDEGDRVESVPALRAARATTGDETVLLVEDEPAVRGFVERTLTDAGYQVLATEGPDAAFTMALRHSGRIHLLLTDIVMPGRSGKALADELARFRVGLATLFMSGYTDDVLLGHSILENGVPFLEKPFTAEQLKERVRQVLDGDWHA
jgi:two-component system cell cycle sensor histidine kinase/response regulator CckA